mmetsp:Transcript_5544/g.7650  ORF Transcript_5544/g.7650 Transcript_5544/m.7650 type:complete len:357 (+) Transcript_5544:78-1148(+)
MHEQCCGGIDQSNSIMDCYQLKLRSPGQGVSFPCLLTAKYKYGGQSALRKVESCEHAYFLRRKPAGYLVPKKILLGCTVTVFRFEEICEFLIPVYSWKHTTAKYCFVSHGQLMQREGDNPLQTLLMILKLFSTAHDDIDYFWVDFACVPREDYHGSFLVQNLIEIVLHAKHLLILPFSIRGNSQVPIFDLESYCSRAWCILEFALFMGRSENISVARLRKYEASLKVSFLDFSSLATEELNCLLHSFVILQDLVLKDDVETFKVFFSANSEGDKEQVWKLLVDSSQHYLTVDLEIISRLQRKGINIEGHLVQPTTECFEYHVHDIEMFEGVEFILEHKHSEACGCNVLTKASCNIM